MSRWLLVPAVLVTAVIVAVTLVVARIPLGSSGSADLEADAGAESRTVSATVIGDSYTAGSSAGGQGDRRWPIVLEGALRSDGLRVTARISAHSGAGYSTRGTSTFTFADAVREDVRADDDLVILFGSTNDASAGLDSVSAAVEDTLTAVEEVAPDAAVLVVGPAWATASALDRVRRLAEAIGQVSEQRGVTFVDPLEERWFLGERSELIDTAALHPTDAGHEALAERLRPLVEPILVRAAKTPRSAASPRTGEATRDAAVGRRLLAVFDDVLLRSYEGSCPDAGPQVDGSLDDGRSFGPIRVPVGQVLGFTETGGVPAVVALDEDCRGPVVVSTPDAGRTWTTGSADGLWSLDADPSRVRTPRGAVDPGCERVLALSVLDAETARAGCDDGRIRSTSDAGRSWDDLGGVEGLRAMAWRTETVGVAFAAQDGCGVQTLATRDGGRTWDRRACLPGQRAEALTVDGRDWVGLVDNFVVSSSDDGRSWKLRRRTD